MPKKYTVKEGETLGIIAEKCGMPSWNYLYQLNKDVIGDNPDLLNAGTVLKIPVIEVSLGYQLLRDKDLNPDDYIGGVRYKYPWVPVSFTIGNPDGTVYKEYDEQGNERAEFVKKKKYEIKDADTPYKLAIAEYKEKSGTLMSIFSPCVIMPMDMDYAHIGGFPPESTTIYHEEIFEKNRLILPDKTVDGVYYRIRKHALAAGAFLS